MVLAPFSSNGRQACFRASGYILTLARWLPYSPAPMRTKFTLLIFKLLAVIAVLD